jgi:hypothetical protein
VTVRRRFSHGLVKGGSAGEVNAVGDQSAVEGAIEVLFGDWRLLR